MFYGFYSYHLYYEVGAGSSAFICWSKSEVTFNIASHLICRLTLHTHTYSIPRFLATSILRFSKKYSSGFTEYRPEKWKAKRTMEKHNPKVFMWMFTASTSHKLLSHWRKHWIWLKHAVTSRWGKTNHLWLIHRANHLIFLESADEDELGFGHN